MKLKGKVPVWSIQDWSFRKSIFQCLKLECSHRKDEWSILLNRWVIGQGIFEQILNELAVKTGMTEKTPNSFDGVERLFLITGSIELEITGETLEEYISIQVPAIPQHLVQNVEGSGLGGGFFNYDSHAIPAIVTKRVGSTHLPRFHYHSHSSLLGTQCDGLTQDCRDR
ncbi:hypothetical protein Tco_0598546 [Tanacetum coccineum]